MDGSIPIYHLYYANADVELGSVATTFPYSRKQGRSGSGQLSATSYTVSKGAVNFWKEHLDRHKVEHSGVQERFGTKYIRFRHPAGLLFEVVEDAKDTRKPWTTKEISADVATHGFLGAVLSVRDVRDQESFFTDALGFKKVGVDGPYHRFEVAGGGAGKTIDLHHEPDRLPGSWGFGAGTAHHIAMNLEDDETMVKQKAIYEELGFTDCSEIKDRFYFHSMYTRSPGGILIECTSNVPGGFYQDETPEDLGTKLHLPPWYEDQRDAIVAQLEPITVPEENRPKGGTSTKPVPVEAGASAGKSAVPLSTYKATFGDKK
jgi:glyoxalase family protein